MGKSDLIIFEEYRSILNEIKEPFESVAFLGFSQESNFTNSIIAKTKHFYDIALKNWEINSDWNLHQKYDLIISTRCPYFSKDPNTFVKKCKKHLNVGGHALIDWGLGDHWRFKDYKVGWRRYGEHEFAYKQDNFLYSCYWNDDLLNDPVVISFWNSIILNVDFAYPKEETLKSVVEKEVPFLVDYNVEKIKTVFLWPERPQLYIITLIKND